MIRLTTAEGICADAWHSAWPLYGRAATRDIEHTAAAALPPHTLMQRAGLAVARLALALAPHAQRVWVACGAGNNGGDGLEAAVHLARYGKTVYVSWLGDPDRAPADALAAWQKARAFRGAPGIQWCDAPPPLGDDDLAIDALLGIGAQRPAQGRLAEWLKCLGRGQPTVLCVDVPSGLDADTGMAAQPCAGWLSPPATRRHTLSLLTLKPGLFTAQGRDACGSIWFDDLGVPPTHTPDALLNTAHPPAGPRPHASHKGSHGDVAVVGGAPGLSGAAVLAACAAVHAGAGRVFLQLLSRGAALPPTLPPDLMVRSWGEQPAANTVACGCGGGDAVRAALPMLLSRTQRLVLDADALNAIAHDAQLQHLLAARATRHGFSTVLTPHPLEAARLLGIDTHAVQADRLAAARQLVQRFGACVVLKGSGSVIAAPRQTPRINPSGNARLAIAGTGDVLAGLIAARMAQMPVTSPDDRPKASKDNTHPPVAAFDGAFHAACAAVWEHGWAAETAPSERTLTASLLASRLQARHPHRS